MFAYHDSASAPDMEELVVMRDAMANRGPDGAGAWESRCQRAALAHRRLSIIDLSEDARQPMQSADAACTIVFNGEIYNYKRLRHQLIGKGCNFSTHSDTEVLLHLYQVHGPRMVEQLRGMYAFAIWDDRKKGLFLARDGFGMKPLYYADDGGAIRFASSVKALLRSPKVDRTVDPAGHVGFLLWGAVPEPHSMYRSIATLPAGTSLWIERGGRRVQTQFFSVSDVIREAENSDERISRAEWPEMLRAAVTDTVAHHMVSDVPVGVFLSGGQDSVTLVQSAAPTARDRLRTFTLGFSEYAGTERDETSIAQEVADTFATEHATEWVSKRDYDAVKGDVLTAMDQPSIDGLNTYFVSRLAHRHALKVALSGVGGDELFGSYPGFHQIPRLVSAVGRLGMSSQAARPLRHLGALAGFVVGSPKLAGVAELGSSYAGAYLLRRGLFLPSELPRIVGARYAAEGLERLGQIPALERVIAGIRSPRLRISALELTVYMRNQLLRDADWAGMAHGLEIRVPFVDVEFLRVIARMSAEGGGPDKSDLADAVRTGTRRQLKKRGFSIPLSQWIGKDAGHRGNGAGPRAWATRVQHAFGVNHKVLVLTPEAFGGHGGIALYNRDLIRSLATAPDVQSVVVLPRLAGTPDAAVPERVEFVRSAAGGKVRYIRSVLRSLKGERYSAVICSHINLLPLAYLASLRTGSPLALYVYGIDAWHPTPSALSNRLTRRVDACISISDVTLERFLGWSGVSRGRSRIIPNAIHLDQYRAGPKPEALLARYSLAGKKVIMTLGRMADEERYKGFDEIITLLPRLIAREPTLVYLLVGDGPDRMRLERRVQTLGLGANVCFAGRIAESEKADHYCLADAFVMPSRGEGFGFVFLEAMACGIPVVASRRDGGREAVLGGRIGRLVDPEDSVDLETQIFDALDEPRAIPPELASFAFPSFERKCHALLSDLRRQC